MKYYVESRRTGIPNIQSKEGRLTQWTTLHADLLLYQNFVNISDELMCN
jgi:hypothetical protein